MKELYKYTNRHEKGPKHDDKLKEIKKNITDSQSFFEQNVKRYQKFFNFVFITSITDEEIQILNETGKPALEFNVLESFISRQRGEFYKNDPKVTVSLQDGMFLENLDKDYVLLIDIIEAHFKSILNDTKNDLLSYNLFTDILGGGFSVAKVCTEYINDKSFEQKICFKRVYDPCLTFFDPIAKDSHKGDGNFCGELFPMTEEDFKLTFGQDMIDGISFDRSVSGFSWSYQNGDQKIVLVADYFEKKKKKETIYKLSNGHVKTKKEYKEMVEMWDSIEQVPIVLTERETEFTTICRYRVCENKILDYVETDYKYLPLVFFDGNSVFTTINGVYKQTTRPIVYHAEGIQKLKNFAGQSLAGELESTIQHKIIASIESIPEDYLEAYTDVQKASSYLYNHFYKGDPSKPLPPPREVNRTPIPPEITNTFRLTDEMTQTIIGSYDTSAGINSAEMSGVAFARSAIQSNTASMPYIVGYIKGLNRVAEIILDLIPKYYKTPRTMPIITKDGKKEFIYVNHPKTSIFMNYDPTSLNIKVEAGLNFEMQKQIALDTVIKLSQANPSFAQFFNEEGLPVLIDNLDIRGSDQLKIKSEEWIKKQKQSQQQQQEIQSQQMQIQTQQNALQMAALQKQIESPTQQEVELEAVKQNTMIEQSKLAIKSQEAETNLLKTMSEIDNDKAELELENAKIVAENTRTAMENLLNNRS